MPMPAAAPGEMLAIPERLIIAPTVGVFRPAIVVAGRAVHAGDEIGVVETLGRAHPVCSPFAGTFMGMLAHAGERLREGQPVAWLRIA